jgi:hypothetical protein
MRLRKEKKEKWREECKNGKASAHKSSQGGSWEDNKLSRLRILPPTCSKQHEHSLQEPQWHKDLVPSIKGLFLSPSCFWSQTCNTGSSHVLLNLGLPLSMHGEFLYLFFYFILFIFFN